MLASMHSYTIHSSNTLNNTTNTPQTSHFKLDNRQYLHADKLTSFVACVQNAGVIKDQDVDFGEVVSAPLPAPSTELLPSKRTVKNTLSFEC